jgi:hypothetical protein
MSMSGTPENPQWFCSVSEASSNQPMSVPIHAGDYNYPNIWYQEGVGFVNNKWNQLIGLPMSFSLQRTIHSHIVSREQDELSQWRDVRRRLNAGEDIMDIEVPHEEYKVDPLLSWYIKPRILNAVSQADGNIPIHRISFSSGYEPDNEDSMLDPLLPEPIVIGGDLLDIVAERDWGNGIVLELLPINDGNQDDGTLPSKIEDSIE